MTATDLLAPYRTAEAVALAVELEPEPGYEYDADHGINALTGFHAHRAGSAVLAGTYDFTGAVEYGTVAEARAAFDALAPLA